MQFLPILAAAVLPVAIMAAPTSDNVVEKRCCDDAVYWNCVVNAAVGTALFACLRSAIAYTATDPTWSLPGLLGLRCQGQLPWVSSSEVQDL